MLQRLPRLLAVVSTLATMLAPAALAAPHRLTIGLSQEPDTLNPLISTMTASTNVRITVLRPVAAVNEVWKQECWMCERIPSIQNGDAKIVDEGGKKKILVTWRLRADAFWGDGKPVVGEDMRLAWRIGVAPTVIKASPQAFEAIEDVILDPADPKRFTLKYKEVRYDYNELEFTFVPLPAHIEGPIFERTKDQQGAYEKQTAYITSPANPGLYNGPYRVKEILPSSHVLLERNAHWKGKAPAFQEVVFRIIPNTQSLEANLLAGSIDMSGGVGVTFDQALAFRKRLATDPSLARRFRVATLEDLIFEHIDFNLREPIVADVRVRKALVHAVDRAKLCDALFDGLQKPAAHAFHPLSPYFTNDVTSYAFDPAKAEALLEEAGWKKGPGGIRVKDGQRLALTIMSTSQNKMRELVQVHLQEAFKRIGVELAIRNEPARTFFGGTLRQARYGHLGMYASTLTSPGDIQISTFHSARIPSAENGWIGNNYMAWSNKTADQRLEAAQTELDEKKRAALVRGVIEQYAADLPQLPLYYRAAVLIAPAALKTNQEGNVDYPTGLRIERWTWEEPAKAH